MRKKSKKIPQNLHFSKPFQPKNPTTRVSESIFTPPTTPPIPTITIGLDKKSRPATHRLHPRHPNRLAPSLEGVHTANPSINQSHTNNTSILTSAPQQNYFSRYPLISHKTASKTSKKSPKSTKNFKNKKPFLRFSSPLKQWKSSSKIGKKRRKKTHLWTSVHLKTLL